jgi:hypothetical protein
LFDLNNPTAVNTYCLGKLCLGHAPLFPILAY